MNKQVSIIAFTKKGEEILQRIKSFFTAQGYDVTSALGRGEDKVNLAQWTKEGFAESDAIVFVGAVGIAVRAIAPYICSKISDPAVIVVDEQGGFCIPVLSGHVGGANKFANLLAEQLGATPVITTATDLNSVFAVDTFAKEHKLKILNPERIKQVSSKLLHGEEIGLYSELSFEGQLPKGVMLSSVEKADVCISYRTIENATALCLVPRVLSVGIGCRKGTAKQQIENTFATVMAENQLNPQAVEGVYSIDLKKEEQGLIGFCRERGLAFRTFCAEELLGAEGDFTSSSFVQSITGVDNICERSASLGSSGDIILRKQALNGVTVAIAAKKMTLKLK